MAVLFCKRWIEKHPHWILTLLVFLSALIKLIDIEKTSLWIDEAYSFLVANGHPYPLQLWDIPEPVRLFYQQYIAWQPLDFQKLIEILKQNVHMPMYYLLLNPWLHWIGNNEFGLRSFSTVFSCLLIIPVYLLTDKMANRKAALWGAFFCALVPFQLFYGQEGRMYSLSMFWACFSAWAFWQFLFSEKRLQWAGIYSATLVGGFFTHYMFLLYLSFHIVVAAWHVITTKQYRLLLWGLIPATILAVCGGLWYPIYKIQQQGVLDNYHFAKETMDLIRYTNKFFLMPMEALANNNIYARYFYFPLAVLIVLDYGRRLWKKEVLFELQREGFLIAWMFVPILVQCLYDATHETHTTIITRYLVLAAPAMVLWCGLTVTKWGKFKLPLAGVMLVLALASVLHQSPMNLHTNKKEISNAAQYLCQHLQPGDLLFTNGPLGAPNLMVFYLNQCKPEQPVIYWVKDYGNQETPLPAKSIMTAYRRIWFFSNRSNKLRGQEMAKAYIRTTHPVQLEHIDPQKQLHLFVLESDRDRYR